MNFYKSISYQPDSNPPAPTEQKKTSKDVFFVPDIQQMQGSLASIEVHRRPPRMVLRRVFQAWSTGSAH